MPHIVTGQILSFIGSPFEMPPDAAARHIRRGALVMDRGRIIDMGETEAVVPRHPDAPRTDLGEALLLPGFVDAHVHYPQTAIIASWGKRLIDWLNSYTFPEEMRFGDPDYAREIAGRYLDLTRDAGTTTVCSYATIHPESVEAFFAEAQRRGQRVLAGKTCMDRNAPEGLRDDAQSAYDQSKALLERWHGQDRLSYVITPRFSPTSTPEQLEALGALWGAHPACLMQTHLSEQTDEITWVQSLFPDCQDYLETYERFGLLGERGVYGHAIHLTNREVDRLSEVGASVVHCPTSNAFIGSGLFDLARLVGTQMRVGLASDTGGGSSFSMLHTMAAAYEIAQLRGTALHPAQLLWLATEGSARALHLEGTVGRLAVGAEADVIALDLAATAAIAQRAARAEDVWSAVFPTIMMGDDRSVAGVWINGVRVKG